MGLALILFGTLARLLVGCGGSNNGSVAPPASGPLQPATIQYIQIGETYSYQGDSSAITAFYADVSSASLSAGGLIKYLPKDAPKANAEFQNQIKQLPLPASAAPGEMLFSSTIARTFDPSFQLGVAVIGISTNSITGIKSVTINFVAPSVLLKSYGPFVYTDHSTLVIALSNALDQYEGERQNTRAGVDLQYYQAYGESLATVIEHF